MEAREDNTRSEVENKEQSRKHKNDDCPEQSVGDVTETKKEILTPHGV